VVGIFSVLLSGANMQYTQDNDGWIKALTSEDNDQLVISCSFNEKTLLKQLQFEGM